jgi:hypothetical protein
MHKTSRMGLFAGGLFALVVAPSAALALDGFGTVPFQGAAAPSLSKQITANQPAITNGFNIVLNYGTSTPTAGEAAAFSAAEAAWESIITGYQSNDVANTTVTINVQLQAIDGAGGILGQAGPQTVKLNQAQNAVTSTWIYTQTGLMQFDTADTAGMVSNGSFASVVNHEMGHVLGIGTLWSSSSLGPTFAGRQELYVSGSGQYTGTFGLAAYNAEFGQAGASVPVELQGGSGTANAHWDELNGGAGATGRVSLLTGQDMQFELMTGWLNSPTFTSTLTTQGMRDLGYVVAVPEPTTLALLALPALLLGRRRRN